MCSFCINYSLYIIIETWNDLYRGVRLRPYCTAPPVCACERARAWSGPRRRCGGEASCSSVAESRCSCSNRRCSRGMIHDFSGSATLCIMILILKNDESDDAAAVVGVCTEQTVFSYSRREQFVGQGHKAAFINIFFPLSKNRSSWDLVILFGHIVFFDHILMNCSASLCRSESHFSFLYPPFFLFVSSEYFLSFLLDAGCAIRMRLNSLTCLSAVFCCLFTLFIYIVFPSICSPILSEDDNAERLSLSYLRAVFVIAHTPPGGGGGRGDHWMLITHNPLV